MSGVILLLALAVGTAGMLVAGYVGASNAADAAALAAAPVTFRPFGASGSPTAEAARFASLNRTRLIRCVCPVDRTFSDRTVYVDVAKSLTFPIVGVVVVRATSRATFEPSSLLPSG